MRKLFVLFIVLFSVLLAGCEHFNQMTQHEKNVVIGTAVGALVIGAVVASDDGGNNHGHNCGHGHGHDCR